MTDTSIRAELRRAAMTEGPIRLDSSEGPLFKALDPWFLNVGDQGFQIEVEEDTFRWFLLLVAEAL